MAAIDETPPRGYSAHDRRRWAAEPAKSRARGPFERDRARVLHSFALRRLAAKTQVVQPGASDFPRTRLTHSLECAQIGRELGGSLGCDPDLVEAACLAHDLGHPPFGHNGEKALDAAAAECGGFEGNAQSLRLLTRLEGKVVVEDDRPGGAGDAVPGQVPGSGPPEPSSAGLNLTRATLDATLKYPWPRDSAGSGRKFNCYPDDLAVFEWIRADAPAPRVGGLPPTCFEAQVMDWADDVAYSVHDLEDALYAGMIQLPELHSRAERNGVCAVAADLYADAGAGELEEVFADLMAEPFWPADFAGDLGSLAALKNLTSELIGRLCRAAEQATRAACGPEPITRYAADLVVPRRNLLECALLKALTAHYVMGRSEAVAYQAREREIVAELVDAVRRGAPATLDGPFRTAYERSPDDAAALRVVIDQVASLTDTSARTWHDRLVS
ncbi:deoxyguanosinetriphosphate triphosphohydrolase [Streptomonospora litoralis]|uniref:Deoxyguanosinetriphosphate triphosphohydrolase-like protein n=1 Tax=Streptomonospora litoralis TaxID=2498135 RepID=A0A4V0ZJF9_9ACTN|nr:deoxyguanosinetriphosphate triphosphohydrolase [Streptomonospora litoralis]QBI53342.1 Deoxyguanosinetriphosphate triphosphohydrolase [Streptomonospora litoralis]